MKDNGLAMKVDLTQINYCVSVVCAAYYVALALRWLYVSRWKADYFFWYVLILVFGVGLSLSGSLYARSFFLSGCLEEWMLCVNAWWWSIRNYILSMILIVISVHSTYRYAKRKGDR